MCVNDESPNVEVSSGETPACNVPYSLALPTSYSFPTAKDEVERLIAHGPARPPAEIRQKLWFEAFGKEEWERLEQEAHKEYEEAITRYEHKCRTVAEDNRYIDEQNNERKLSYARQKERHAAELDGFIKKLNPERVTAKLTVAVLKTFLEQKQTVRNRFQELWEASESRTWPLSRPKPKNIDYKYCSSRHERLKALWSVEKSAFVFLTPPFPTPFIKNLSDVKSPLVFVRNYEHIAITHIGPCYPRSMETVHLCDYGILGYASWRLNDFDWLWEDLEETLRSTWGRLIDIDFNGDWTITAKSCRHLAQYQLASECPGLHHFIDAELISYRPPSCIGYDEDVPPPIPRLSPPDAPSYQTPPMPTPPPECYDGDLVEEQRVILRGALLQNVEYVLRESRRQLFATNTLRPYFLFGGVPFPFLKGQARHFLCIGQTGSGKSTLIRHLMSQFLPLTKKRTQAILARSEANAPPKPSSPHEWTRSLTFQAVVYNAKSEHVPVLEAFGFNSDAGAETDLFILDPNDSRCYGWDIAEDIASVSDAENFAAMLVPIAEKAVGENSDKIWQLEARNLILAVIISLRNLTLRTKGRQTWNFRDVIYSMSTPETLREVLQYHDTPRQIVAKLIDLSDGQKSSIYMTATGYMSQFSTIAEQWHEAEQQGRTISLTDWTRHGRNTVLVLPNTPDNASYAPLNRALLAALTKLFISAQNTFYRDVDGRRRKKKRYVFIDEFGDAGPLSEMGTLFTQGRSFGVSVVAGLIDLPSLHKFFDQETAKTCRAQLSYKALLRSEDEDTQKWMSHLCGQRREKYTKDTDTVGTSFDRTTGQSDGTTTNVTYGMQLNYAESDSQSDSRCDGRNDGSSHTTSADPKVKNTKTTQQTTSTSNTHQDTHGTQTNVGVNNQTSHGETHSTNSSEKHGTNKSKATTWDLQTELNMLPSEFGQFLDPSVTGFVAGCYKTPSFAGWRADLPFSALRPEYEQESALETTAEIREWSDKWEVSRPKEWTEQDYERLGLAAGQPFPQPIEQRRCVSQQEFVAAGGEKTAFHLDRFAFEE